MNNKYDVPDGYALISIDALKAWGKYDEVRNACRFPADQATVKESLTTQEPVAWIAVADEMPKPHKPVLVRYVITSPVYGGTRSKVIRAQWIPAKTEESNDDDHFEYDEETDTYYIPEGWYELVDNWDEYSSIHVCEGDITHWMRLPEFPNAAPVQQAEQEPGEWINEDELPEFYPYDDMYQSSKVINGVRMFPNVKVSDRSMFYALTKDHTWISVTETQFNKLKPECRMKCYIAPVRTKDLTDEEIAKAVCSPLDEVYLADFRAVIAADREKNRA